MHLVPSWSGNLNQNKVLFYYRCVAATLVTLQCLYCIVYDFITFGMVQLQYLTVEGLFLTTVTMNVLVSSHLVFRP